jgi:RNA polymerase sigma-70 factor, ECF subfamily
MIQTARPKSHRLAATPQVDGPPKALEIVDALAAEGELANYRLLRATRADLHRRIGSRTEAAQSYSRALELVTNDRDRRFLERRLSEVG